MLPLRQAITLFPQAHHLEAGGSNPASATNDSCETLVLSEEQFEAYRALGFHAMDRDFTSDDESVKWRTALDRLLADLSKK